VLKHDFIYSPLAKQGEKNEPNKVGRRWRSRRINCCKTKAINRAGKKVEIMECRKQINLKDCNCSYPGCPRKGICCLCLRYHKAREELPACYFPPDAEKTHDRSIANFIKTQSKKNKQ